MLRSLSRPARNAFQTVTKRNCIRATYFSRFHASTSLFPKIALGPKDPILGIQELFVADPNPQKVSLGVGAYRDDNGKPWILPSVRKAENKLINSPDYNHEYFPISGSAKLCNEAKKLMYGDNASDLDTMVAMQSLSGTGSLRVLFGFIKEQWTISTNYDSLPPIYVPNQTWGNHRTIAAHAGLQSIDYPYYDPKTNGLDMDNMIPFLQKIPKNSVVLFHAVAHNPTGVDPTQEQWKTICDVIKKQEVSVLFDSAYQGFASGDCAKDAFAPRHFRAEGIRNIMLAQSFAKNMGLYGQRTGVVSIDCTSKDEYEKVLSQIKMVARAMYSNPSTHGGKIAEMLLSDPDLRKEWVGTDIVTMSDRIITMRKALREILENKLRSSRSWKHITDQIGMFCFTGVTPEQCDKLMKDYSIYLTRNGRISIAGLNTGNVERVAEAIDAVTK